MKKIFNFLVILRDILNIFVFKFFLNICWFFVGFLLKVFFVDILFYGIYNWIGFFFYIGFK